MHSHDVEYALTTGFLVSAVMFLVCVCILISGACVEQHYDTLNRRSQLQFISTQIGACLERHAWVSYGVVLAMQLQLLVLLLLFFRCLHSWSGSRQTSMCMTEREQIALRCALLVISFVTSMTSVVEFRSESIHTQEQIYHYSAAVWAITVFWLIHVSISFHLRRFADTIEYRYVCGVYMTLTITFFVLWLGHRFVALSELSKVIEWVLLFNGVLLHCYAVDCLQRHTCSTPTYTVIFKRAHMPVVCVAINFACTCILYALTAPPWFVATNTPHLGTGPVFWVFVTGTHVLVTLLLVYA